VVRRNRTGTDHRKRKKGRRSESESESESGSGSPRENESENENESGWETDDEADTRAGAIDTKRVRSRQATIHTVLEIDRQRFAHLFRVQRFNSFNGKRHDRQYELLHQNTSMGHKTARVSQSRCVWDIT